MCRTRRGGCTRRSFRSSRQSRLSDGAVPRRGDAHPDGAVLHVPHHVRAESGLIVVALAWTYPPWRGGSSAAARSPGCWCSPQWGSRCARRSSCSATTTSCTSSNRSCAPSSPPSCSPASVVIGRPLIARFADDFCPLTPDVQCRPAIVQLYRRLTYLWAGVNAITAATSLTLSVDGPGGRVRRRRGPFRLGSSHVPAVVLTVWTRCARHAARAWPRRFRTERVVARLRRRDVL